MKHFINLKDIPAKDLIRWGEDKVRKKYDISYKPIVNYKEERQRTLEIYKKKFSKY